MATPTPNQQITNEFGSLISKINSLQDGDLFTNTRVALEDIQTTISNMRLRVAN